MTENKPIYLNGVDVAGCEDYGYRGKAGYWCHNYDEPCTDYPNCYYKQLKRKEQECKELKKDLHQNFEEKDKLHLIIDRLLEASGYDTNTASAEDFEDVYENMRYEKEQLDQLKAENEEYKKDNQAMRNSSDLFCKNADKICRLLENKLDQLEAEKVKAEQKLKKVRQVCAKAKDVGENINDMYTAKLSGLYLKSRQILQIIDEVE